MTNQPHMPNLLSTDASRGFWKILTLPLFVLLALLLFSTAAAYVWASGFEERIPPNTFVGSVELSGLNEEEARQQLQKRVDKILTEGVRVSVNGEQKQLSLITLISTDLTEDVAFHIDDAIDQAMALHDPHPLKNTARLLTFLVEPTILTMEVEIQEELIKDRVLSLYPEKETLSVPTSFVISQDASTWSVEVVEGENGTEFQWEPFLLELNTQLASLDDQVLSIALADRNPDISTEEAEAQTNQALAALETAPYAINLPESEESGWQLTAEDLSQMIQPGTDDRITLDRDNFQTWATPITEALNKSAQNARLTIEDGRVVDFVESREGVSIDSEAFYASALGAVQIRSESPIKLTLVTEEAVVKTADVNDLGITEILGTGTSSYRGSPSNRRKNIQNGVDLLNGLLIPPGETFSLIKALSPFTYENGYLPELVIKGDKIQPEMGGGLCQIGTTTFRATMNAGLAVTERRNHSLVVSYYNDPANGNPGTDATIYEPAPDYKFTNDTEHYVLFQAENLTDTQDLRFTFWGTSDGRKGSYEPPIVHRWIPVGATQYIESVDLEPGEEQCQEAHMGADASFVYTVMHANGEIEETTYSSHYRPLPRICLVGAEPEPEPEANLEENVSSSAEESDETEEIE